MKTYASFGLSRSFRQLYYAVQSRKDADKAMSLLYGLVKRDESRIEDKLGEPLRNKRILEVGVGQGMERARYFGIHNSVLGMDLDVIPAGFDLAEYAEMVKKNGIGRFLKTVGRKIIVARPNRRGWEKATGIKDMQNPKMVYGDICKTVPEIGAFDVAACWSVFEHLPDPQNALNNMITALRPGGVVFISIHLYTANNGHHDIQAFTGGEENLPPWGHLRPAKSEFISPSSYLNEWRLSQWRELFSSLAPGHEEFLEYQNQKYVHLMTAELREELHEYSDEELFTIDVIYIWKKPNRSPRSRAS